MRAEHYEREKVRWSVMQSERETDSERRYGWAALVVLVCAAWLIAVISLGWCYLQHIRLLRVEQQLEQAHKDDAQQRRQIAEVSDRLQVETATLAQSMGMTQKQLETKARELALVQEQQREEAERLGRAQAAAKQQLGKMTSEVSDVKSDIGDVKSDVAATRSEVETAKAELKRTKGDAGVMSGLIARNHDELEMLRQRGTRNYFEFTLRRDGPAEQVSTLQLRLTHEDEKRSRYTMVVTADDRTIEKRDKSLMEPVQFYTGANRELYEIVVNSMTKDRVSGYLSTPKSE